MQDDDHQSILILAGLVGSGKSNFASYLQSIDPRFVRISQDLLGSRRACEVMAKESLDQGKSIIIDRQNFNPNQRATWIKIAQHSISKNPSIKLSVHLIEFATPYEECLRRLKLRTNHETLHSIGEAIGILRLVSKDWIPPQASEGFDRHLILIPLGTHPDPNLNPSAISYSIPHPLSESVIRSILSLLHQSRSSVAD